MTTQRRAHLFQDSGPEAALQYLWQRLQARDLSRDEALAMLSALHEDLGRAQGRNPRLYAAYGQFMQALRHDMPQVHAYVLAKWEQSHRPAGSPRAAADAYVAAAEAPVADTGETKPVFINRPSSLIPTPEWVPSKAEGPGEPWETDEDPETNEQGIEAAQAHESGDEDPESAEAELDETQAGEEERLEDDDPIEADELEAASEQEEDEQGERAEAEQAESDVPEDLETEETEADSEQQGGRAEAGSAEPSDESAGGEEGEWPAAEEAEPLEPNEGFESEAGEEGEEPAVD